jgi:hypothetical protein
MLFYEYIDFFHKSFKSQPLKKEISKEMTIQRESTVNSSNFVILLRENIFFCQTFFRLPHNFFWY